MPTPHVLLLVPMLVALAAPGPAAPDSGDRAAQAYDQVWSLWNAKRYDEARQKAETLVDRRPQDGMAHAVLGYVLDAYGERDAADEHLDRAVALAPRSADVLRLVGDVHATRFGDLVGTDQSYAAPAERAAAEDLYRRWAAVEPDSPLPLARLAWVRRKANEGASALGLLYAAVSLDPLVDGPHNDLWSFLNREVTYDELAGFYEGLSLGDLPAPARARCADYQGLLLRYKGDKRRQEARALSPKDDPTGRVTKLREAVEAYDAALPCFERATTIDASVLDDARRHAVEALVARVGAFGDMGDFPAARRGMEKARRALLEEGRVGSDTFKRDVDLLSFALFTAAGGEGGAHGPDRYRKDMDVLREFWKWAVSVVKDDPKWWNNYGFFCREAGRYEESWEAYNRCIELAPDDVRFLNDTALIQIYHLRSDLDRAEALLKKAVALGEKRAEEGLDDDLRSALGDALLNMGVLYTSQGRFDEADEALARLADLDPERPDLKMARERLRQARSGGAAKERDDG